MLKPTLIVIAGPPCAGKTTLGRALSDELGLAFISKDDIKESLFNSLGASDREWSRKLGAASWELLYHFARVILKRRTAVVVEANFRLRDAPQLRELITWSRCKPFQIYCTADESVLLARFKARAESGKRHPGHVDHMIYAEFEESLRKGEYGLLDIGGQSITVDTTDLSKVDYKSVFRAVHDQF